MPEEQGREHIPCHENFEKAPLSSVANVAICFAVLYFACYIVLHILYL